MIRSRLRSKGKSYFPCLFMIMFLAMPHIATTVYAEDPPSFLLKWGTPGSDDGQFNTPMGIAVGTSGSVYVADTGNNRIQKFNSNGIWEKTWGSFGTADNQFNEPRGIAVDTSGNVYVADRENQRIQKASSDGDFVTILGETGIRDCFTVGRFNYPYDVAVDGSGNIYVVDLCSRIQVFDGTGTIVTSWDIGTLFSFSVAVRAGYVYITNTLPDQIIRFASDGTDRTEWGSEGFGDGQFDGPQGVTLDASGNIYVADTNNHRIQKLDGNGNFLSKWGPPAGGNLDGWFDRPYDVAVDTSGYVYVADTYNNRIQKFGPPPPPSPPLSWAKKAGSTGLDSANKIRVDSNGNSYVTGSFSGTATFGSGELNQTTLTSGGGFDLFVAKYDGAGRLVWAKKAGSASDFEGEAIAVDGDGNSCVTGYYTGTSTFGAGEPTETPLTSDGGMDIFVAKYDRYGHLVWAKKAGGDDDDRGWEIAVDNSGNIYVTGFFKSTAWFGGGTTLTSAGDQDLFVAKYDSDGDLLWAKRAGGANLDQASGIAVDSSGNSYVTGPFEGTATFGAGEGNQTILTSGGNRDLFVAKYDSSGLLIWVRQAEGVDFHTGRDIAVDGSGNSYVTGIFDGTVTFDKGGDNETILSTPHVGDHDVFVAKYSSGGDFLWARQAGGIGALDHGQDIIVDGDGNSYVTGQFSDMATFGSVTLTSAGDLDSFVAKYDTAGGLVWARRDGGTGIDTARGIALDGAGNIYVTGDFEVTATFGLGETHVTTLTSAGASDIFVAKYGSDDADGDGVTDSSDNCPVDFNPGQGDEDGDGVGDLCDNCPVNSNPSQNDVCSASSLGTISPLSPVLVEGCFEVTDATKEYMFRPTCANSVLEVLDASGNTVATSGCVNGPAQGIPDDLVPLRDGTGNPIIYCTEPCNLLERFLPEDLVAGTYKIKAVYTSLIQCPPGVQVPESADGPDVCPRIWMGTVESAPVTVSIPPEEYRLIDVYPGTYPNLINLGAKGVTPVAIFGSPAFDVAQVDVSSIEMGGASVALSSGKGKEYQASITDWNGDGYLDLLVKFTTKEMVNVKIGDTTITLTGTKGGDPFEGQDSIVVVK